MTLPLADLADPYPGAKGRATVTGDRLNVRSIPALAGVVLGQLRAGAVVDVWAVVDGWAIVQDAAGLTGWASLAYLQATAPFVA